MLKITAFFCLILLLSSQPAASQNISPPLRTADSLFARGRYEAAYPYYKQALRGTRQASVRQLLRMAYVQEGLGHHPAALYYLSLAQVRQPKAALGQKISALAQAHRLTGYATTWQQELGRLLRRYYYRGLQVLLIGAVAGAVLLLLRRRGRSGWLLYGGYLLLALAYLNGLQPARLALVARPHAALMAGPSAGAAWLSTAAAGDRLVVQGQQDIWYRVQWQGRQAYIRRQDLLLVN